MPYFDVNGRQFFLFTASRPEAKKHLEKTIEQPVPMKIIEEYVPSYAEKLREETNGEVYAWGAVPGDRNSP